MTTYLFATCRLMLDKDTFVEPNCRIPEELLKKLEGKPGKGRSELLARGFAKELTVEPVAQAPAVGASVNTIHPHEWRYTPESLKDKNLDALNILIVEHVKKHGLAAVPPFETKEEAIFFLGQDLKK